MVLKRLKKYISFIIVALVALQVLNLGLYAQDFEVMPQYRGKNCNIINSVAEYVAEVVMNKFNAFPEKKEKPNQKEHDSNFKFQPFKIVLNKTNRSSQLSAQKACSYECFVVKHYSNHTTDILSPPPKAAC